MELFVGDARGFFNSDVTGIEGESGSVGAARGADDPNVATIGGEVAGRCADP